jgi:hypothetical protein
MRVRVREERENNFVHGKLLARIHGVAIHGIERERGGGRKRRKSRVLFLVGV